MPEPRLTQFELGQLSDRAIAKIDARGRRGAEQCSLEEIIAMAGYIIVLRLRLAELAKPPSTPPSKETPDV